LIAFDRATSAVAQRIAAVLSLETADIEALPERALEQIDVVIVSDLHDLALVRSLRRTLGAKPPPGLVRAFAVASSGAARHADEVQANALGATHFLKRDSFLPQLQQMLSIARREPLDPARVKDLRKAAGGEAIVATGKLLAEAFGDFASGGAIAAKDVEALGQHVIASIGTAGTEGWLASVRNYHEGTFQHCLLVTGTVASFANLHIPKPEVALKLTTAALLHDIGKAAVPLHILDKPGKLTAEEFEAIKRHPAAGYDYLVTQKDIDPQVLDAVRHHHEALDGSGYPDRLKGDQISPLTRILTVCDIFAALVEARSYKPAKPPEEAITILVGMALDGKVDYQVVRGLAEAFAIQTPKTLAEVQSNLMELRR
jgi:putative nucleotidyltransferase with HDIG domain